MPIQEYIYGAPEEERLASGKSSGNFISQEYKMGADGNQIATGRSFSSTSNTVQNYFKGIGYDFNTTQKNPTGGRGITYDEGALGVLKRAQAADLAAVAKQPSLGQQRYAASYAEANPYASMADVNKATDISSGVRTGEQKKGQQLYMNSDVRGDSASEYYSGLQKLQKNAGLFGSQFASQTDDQILASFGYTPSRPPSDATPLAMAEWRAMEAENKAAATMAFADQTADDVQTRYAQAQESSRRERMARGISEYEKDSLNDPNSEINISYNQELSDLDQEKSRAMAKLDEQLGGLNEQSKAFYRKGRVDEIEKRYNDTKKDLDRQRDKMIRDAAKDAYLKDQKESAAYAQANTPAEQARAAKEAAIQRASEAIMTNWNREHPNGPPLEQWQAREMAEKKLQGGVEDQPAIDRLNSDSAMGLYNSGSVYAGQEISKAFAAFGGDMTKARSYWKGKIPDEVIDAQEEAEWQRQGYDIETTKKAKTLNQVKGMFKKALELNPDGDQDTLAMNDDALTKIKDDDPVSFYTGYMMATTDGYTARQVQEWKAEADSWRNQEAEKYDTIVEKLRATNPSRLKRYEKMWDIIGDKINTYQDIDAKKLSAGGGEGDDSVQSFLSGTDEAGNPSFTIEEKDFLVEMLDKKLGRMESTKAGSQFGGKDGGTMSYESYQKQVLGDKEGPVQIPDSKVYTLDEAVDKYSSVDKSYIDLIKEHFPKEEWGNAIMVMGGESGGRANANRAEADNPGGGEDVGLFQINTKFHPEAFEAGDMMNPAENVREAARIFKERGWKEWVAAKNLGLTEPVVSNERRFENNQDDKSDFEKAWERYINN